MPNIRKNYEFLAKKVEKMNNTRPRG
jgi:hypothetical protein